MGTGCGTVKPDRNVINRFYGKEVLGSRKECKNQEEKEDWDEKWTQHALGMRHKIYQTCVLYSVEPIDGVKLNVDPATGRRMRRASVSGGDDDVDEHEGDCVSDGSDDDLHGTDDDDVMSTPPPSSSSSSASSSSSFTAIVAPKHEVMFVTCSARIFLCSSYLHLTLLALAHPLYDVDGHTRQHTLAGRCEAPA